MFALIQEWAAANFLMAAAMDSDARLGAPPGPRPDGLRANVPYSLLGAVRAVDRHGQHS